MTMCAGSYRLGAFKNPRAELGRLNQQARVAWNREQSFLQEAGLGPNARVLDLGCGAGEITRRLAQAAPAGEVIGLDRDPELLPPCEANGTPRFVLGDVEVLPAALGSFDLIYARFLLQHLPRPKAVLSAAAARLQPQGALALLDSDDAFFVLDPPDPELEQLLAAARVCQERLGGDRQIGRRLPALLAQAGLSLGAYRVQVFTSLEIPFETLFGLATGYKAALLGGNEAFQLLGARLTREAAAGQRYLAVGVCWAYGRSQARA